MCYPYPYTGPYAPYNNVPINAQYFAPSALDISGITTGLLTTVTTSVNHNYVISQQVRLIIPPSFGTRQLNESLSIVVSIPAPNQVVLNISSIGADPFIASSATTKAQIVPVGSVSTGQINSSGPMS